MSAPKKRCGFVLDPKEVGVDIENDSHIEDLDDWYRNESAVCCWLESWEGADSGRCVWHAEIKRKSSRSLPDLPAQPERLDGAFLQRAHLSEVDSPRANLRRADLSKAYISGANLSEANLRMADLSEADLAMADLSGANLSVADLPATNLNNADLSGADLTIADLSGAGLFMANLSGANLLMADLPAANLSKANLSEANLSKANLSEANLIGACVANATLTDADCTNASLRNATFWYATLEDTALTGSDVRGTDFRSARLYQAVFRETRINSTTQFVNVDDDFFGRCTYELSPDAILENDKNEFDYSVHPYEAAAWVYRQLQSLHEENALSESTREFHIRKEDVQRKNHWREGNYPRWAVATLSKYLTNYGESFKHLFRAWVVTILGFAVLYALPIVGGVEDRVGSDNSLTTFRIDSLSELFSLGGLETLGRAVYFSSITFTTIGYANVAPSGLGSRALVVVESLLGAIMIALFVFVLGRRVAR